MQENIAVIIIIFSAFQSSTVRMVAALSYAIIHAMHFFVDPFLDGYAYYFSAGVADVLIMWLLLKAPKFPDISISLFRVCIAEVFVNAFGWFLWYKEYEPTLYVNIFYMLNIWVLLILIRKDRANDIGEHQIDNWADRVLLVVSPSFSIIPRRSS